MKQALKLSLYVTDRETEAQHSSNSEVFEIFNLASLDMCSHGLLISPIKIQVADINHGERNDWS